jgi:hypothetical protein
VARIDIHDPSQFIGDSRPHDVGNVNREFGIFERSKEMMKTETLNNSMSLADGNQGAPSIRFDNKITQINAPTPESRVELFTWLGRLGRSEREPKRNGRIPRNGSENRCHILPHDRTSRIHHEPGNAIRSTIPEYQRSHWMDINAGGDGTRS